MGKIVKKGFTLVELLAVLVILSIIFAIGFSSYAAYTKSANEKTKKIEIAQIINSAAAYHKEMQQEENYLYYVDEKNIKYSCISIKSLMDMGYYKGNASFLNEELLKEKNKAVVKIKEVNGVASYEVVAPYTEDKDCVYYYVSSEIADDTDIILKDADEDNNVSLTTKIKKVINSKNSYLLNMHFNADFYSHMENYSAPLYVLLVLDVSGSMHGNSYNKAVEASIALSEKIVNDFENSYVGLINFSDSAFWKRGFKHLILTNDDFSTAYGGTNVLHALDMAYEKIGAIPLKQDGIETIKYVIFLSDGQPNISYHGDRNDDATLTRYADRIKSVDNTTFMVVGYNIRNAIYRKISSIDTSGSSCPENSEVSPKYCYYSSDTNNIGALFNNMSNVISQSVRTANISKSKIHLEFSNAVKLIDASGNKVSKLDLDVDLTENIYEVLNRDYQYTLTVDKIADSKFTCDYEKKVCTYELPIFKKYYVNLYDIHGSFFKKLEPSSYPTLVVTKNLKDYIN